MYSNLTVSPCILEDAKTTVGVMVNHLSIRLTLIAIALQYFIGTCAKAKVLFINILMI